jgi:hypothetical protein
MVASAAKSFIVDISLCLISPAAAQRRDGFFRCAAAPLREKSSS